MDTRTNHGGAEMKTAHDFLTAAGFRVVDENMTIRNGVEVHVLAYRVNGVPDFSICIETPEYDEEDAVLVVGGFPTGEVFACYAEGVDEQETEFFVNEALSRFEQITIRP